MCGILGLSVTSGSSNLQDRMMNGIAALRHRGPDDHGSDIYEIGGGAVSMGHTRLSIIDLSSAGRQPMQSADGRYALVFNGEIYNYIELRDELVALGHEFYTETDTEVLLASWRYWGDGCLHRLKGMFAFVVLDQRDMTLTCVRDPFGIKPLYYAMDCGEFIFASEIPVINSLKRGRLNLDFQRAYDYLVYGDYDSGSRSFIADVSHLLPGHIIRFDLNTRSLSEQVRWWVPNIVERHDLSFENAVAKVRDIFLENVKLHLRSDVPLGVALSGGIDSSAIACAIRYLNPKFPIHTFSYVASGGSISEERWIDWVNNHIQAIPHKVTVNSMELALDLDDMIRSQGEPFGSTSIYAQYRVFKAAKEQGITVTLDGQGADEMLAGYIGYPGQRIRSLIETGRYVAALNFLNDWSKWPGRNRLLALKHTAGEMAEGRAYALFRSIGKRGDRKSWINYGQLQAAGIEPNYPRQRPDDTQVGRRVMSELALSLTRRGLPSLLRHGDRNSMRFSVESRVPFLTTDMVNLLLSLPESYLISANGQTKHIFRSAMRGIVPDNILDRRDKIGFETPEHQWMLSMADQIRQWLRVDLGLAFLNQSEMMREFDAVMGGRQRFSWQIWRWINFSRWYVNMFS